MQAERDALAARVTELEGLTTTQTQNENHLLRVPTIPFSFSLDGLHRLFCAMSLMLMVGVLRRRKWLGSAPSSRLTATQARASNEPAVVRSCV